MFFVLFNAMFFVLVKTYTYKITNMIYFSWASCV